LYQRPILERCAGLVFGFLFQDGRASRVNDESLAANLDLCHDWIWLHLSLADHRAKRFIESFDLLPRPARQLMLAPRDERIQFHFTPISVLTAISTLLLPPTFGVGAFGMNVGGIPWGQSAHGFWAAVGCCVLLVLGGWTVLRRFRILP
jgi:Mg2+ and Co2+ transporter CorA